MNRQWMSLTEWAREGYFPDFTDAELIQFFDELRAEARMRGLNLVEDYNQWYTLLRTVAYSLEDDFLRIYTPKGLKTPPQGRRAA